MNESQGFTLSPKFRRIFPVFAVLYGLVGIGRIVESFLQPDLYKKDFISPYLLAKAMIQGGDPYLPLPELARIWMSYANYTALDHPTPHPPVFGLFAVPFALLSYEKAAVLWLFFELGCLLASVALLHRWWRGAARPGWIAVWFAFALGWTPVAQDLWFSQLSCFLLLLMIGAWLSLREGRDAMGGTLLGGLMAFKLLAWPVVLYLVLRRRWRGVIAYGVVWSAAHLIAVAVTGLDSVRDYYLKIGPQLASYYRPHDSNFSAWTWGHRLFIGGGENFIAQPLWPSDLLAKFFIPVIPALILAAGLWLAGRAKQFDTSFGILVCVAVLVSPIAWTHYLMFASIPILIIARRLRMMDWPRKLTVLAFVLWLSLSMSQAVYAVAALMLGYRVTADGVTVVSFPVWLLTMFPAFALCALSWVVWRSDPQAITWERPASEEANVNRSSCDPYPQAV
jgi:hypothetical protein